MVAPDCPCVDELMPIILNLKCVELIGEYIHRGDADIIKSLTRPNVTPYLRHGPPWNQELLTSAETQDYTIKWYRDYELMAQPLENHDRWIFEVGIRHPATSYKAPVQKFIRFLGKSIGSPQVGSGMMRCIITVVRGKIVVDIDTILVNIDPNGDFGTYHGTPFMRSRRAKLRSQIYTLHDLESDHPSHTMFNHLCDLIHQVIWAYLH